MIVVGLQPNGPLLGHILECELMILKISKHDITYIWHDKPGDTLSVLTSSQQQKQAIRQRYNMHMHDHDRLMHLDHIVVVSKPLQ